MNRIHKDFLSTLGYLFLQYGRRDKAFTVFTALCKLFPDDVRLGLSLGYIHLLHEEYAPALQRADQFLYTDINADDEMIGLLLRSRALLGLGRKKEARAVSSRLIQQRQEAQ